MFELTIKNTVYQFKFGIGFLKEINPIVQRPVDGVPGVKEDMGLAYVMSEMLSGNMIALVKILYAANKGQNPRVTIADLEDYVDDESTDIDKLCDEIVAFLKRANATKKISIQVESAINQSEQMSGTEISA